jgi:UDPglucose 6-dehydrogenase
VVAVDIGGRRYPVRAGWNRLELGLRGASSLSVHLDVEQKPGPRVTAGIRELRIPGVTAREALRPPTVAEEALEGADAAILVTEWPEFAGLDWPALAAKMRSAVIVDGRNFLDGEELRAAGFAYEGIGR